MKRTLNNILGISIMLVTLFSACKKEDKATEGDLTIKLSHAWGMSGATFALNTDLVHPMNGDTMNFSKFKYYVSNIKLKKDDGNWWVHPESYFLVDLSNTASLNLALENVPVGEYTEMTYTLGVDSTRNVSGAQSGALSTTMDMFWSWTTGYIMVKAEGNSPQSTSGNFVFHLGGFSGANNIVTKKNIQFTADKLTISGDKTSEVYIIANPAKLFHADPLSDGTTLMMPGAKAIRMSSNFYGGFVFDKIVE